MSAPNKRPCSACERGEPTQTPPKTGVLRQVVAVHSPSGNLCTRTMSDEMWAMYQSVMDTKFGGK